MTEKAKSLFEIDRFQAQLAVILRGYGGAFLSWVVFLLTLGAFEEEDFWLVWGGTLVIAPAFMVALLYAGYWLDLLLGRTFVCVSGEGIGGQRKNRPWGKVVFWDNVERIEKVVDEKGECVFVRIVRTKGSPIEYSAHMIDLASMLSAIERTWPNPNIVAKPAKERTRRVARRLLKNALAGVAAAVMLRLLVTLASAAF